MTTTTVTIPKALYDALCRVARLSVGLSIGGPVDSFANDLRLAPVKDRPVWNSVATLLDVVQAWADSAGADIPDPDYDGPGDRESGPPRDPQRERAEDADR